MSKNRKGKEFMISLMPKSKNIAEIISFFMASIKTRP